MIATIELEKNEKDFDNETDDIFIKRFLPLNRLLKQVKAYQSQIVHTDAIEAELVLQLTKTSEVEVLNIANKVDHFKDYKV